MKLKFIEPFQVFLVVKKGKENWAPVLLLEMIISLLWSQELQEASFFSCTKKKQICIHCSLPCCSKDMQNTLFWASVRKLKEFIHTKHMLKYFSLLSLEKSYSNLSLKNI